MSTRADPVAVEVAGNSHPATDPLCPECRIGYPVACVCGGWVHAGDPSVGGAGDGPVAYACGRCGTDARPAEPLTLDGDRHAPGRADCPACPAGHPAPCLCGGLIHLTPAGHRRCDRCGPRCEDLDI